LDSRGGRPHFVFGISAIVLICAVAMEERRRNRRGFADDECSEDDGAGVQKYPGLKGIPADQLIPAMQFITASLGVECEFCHVKVHSRKTTRRPSRRRGK